MISNATKTARAQRVLLARLGGRGPLGSCLVAAGIEQVALATHGADVGGVAGSGSILRRSRATRISILRSKGSRSKPLSRSTSRSRESTRLGRSAGTAGRTPPRSGGPPCRSQAGGAPPSRRRAEGALRGRGAVLGGACGASHQGVEPGQQFAGTEGLGQVVVGANFKSDDPVDFLAARRQHQDGHGRVRAHFARQAGRRRPAASGRGRWRRACRRHPAASARRRRRDPPRNRLCEVVGEQPAQPGVVVPHEDPVCPAHGRQSSPAAQPVLLHDTN